MDIFSRQSFVGGLLVMYFTAFPVYFGTLLFGLGNAIPYEWFDILSGYIPLLHENIKVAPDRNSAINIQLWLLLFVVLGMPWFLRRSNQAARNVVGPGWQRMLAIFVAILGFCAFYFGVPPHRHLMAGEFRHIIFYAHGCFQFSTFPLTISVVKELLFGEKVVLDKESG